MDASSSRLAMTTEHYRYYPLDYIASSAKRIGFENVELFLAPPQVWIDWKRVANVEEVRGQMKAHGLRVCAVRPEYGSLRYAPFARDAQRAERSLKYYENVCALAQALEAPIVSLAPCGACLDEPKDEAFAHAVAQLKRICEIAGSMGVRIALESSPECGAFLAGSALALKELTDRVPSLCVTLDIAAMCEAGETIHQWFDLFADRIIYVRLSDGRKASARCICGEGIFPMARFLCQLQSHGYCGPLALPLGGDAYDDPSRADEQNWKAVCGLLAEEGSGK